jgi:hypothetical protein
MLQEMGFCAQKPIPLYPTLYLPNTLSIQTLSSSLRIQELILSTEISNTFTHPLYLSN